MIYDPRLPLPRPRLVVELQGVKEGRVSHDDPRVELRGGRGLYASRRLKRGHVVGVYRSYVTLQKPHEDFALSGLPSHLASSMQSSELALREAWDRHVESYCWCDLAQYAITIPKVRKGKQTEVQGGEVQVM